MIPRRLVLLLVLGAAGAPLAATASPRLNWRLEASRRNAGQVQFTLSHADRDSQNMTSRSLALTNLQGLNAAQLNARASAPVSFRVVRDAGTFLCRGEAGQGRGSGGCHFQPSASFAGVLRARGVGQASDADLLQLAVADVGVPLLDVLKRHRYAMPDVASLIRAGHHGVNVDFVQEMAGVGYRLADLDALIRLRDHGVTADYAEGLARAGYRGLSAEEIVRLRDHGVTVAYVVELQGQGYRDLTPEQLVKLRDHAVTATFIRTANANGRLSPEDLIRRRDRGPF